MFSGGDEGSGGEGRDRKWAMMKKTKISEDLITTVETEKKQ